MRPVELPVKDGCGSDGTETATKRIRSIDFIVKTTLSARTLDEICRVTG
jgi:hypothetical protein